MILTINPGSSTIKCALFDDHGNETATLQLDSSGPYPLLCSKDGDTALCSEDTKNAFQLLLDAFEKNGYLIHVHQIEAIAMRVVHGGTHFHKTTEITEKNIEQLREVSRLAPLHNPPAVRLIEEILSLPKHPPLYACFDTAFHHTIPEYIAEYALPRAYETKFGIRKYGFHGLSCQSILSQLASLNIGKIPEKIIICHLGSGASVTAIKNGMSFDTSMGLTPLEGVVMRTRGGDMDPGVVLELFRHVPKENTVDEAILFVEEILNNESGLKALTGGISDMRIIIEQANAGNEFCKIAIDSFTYHVRKYIGAYNAILGGCDALVFTGGIGEGSNFIRNKIIEPLHHLGCSLDADLNSQNKVPSAIEKENSATKIFILPSHEAEIMYEEVLQVRGEAR